MKNGKGKAQLRLACPLVVKLPINSYVYYEVDDQEAAHALSLDKIHRERTGKALSHQWVRLKKVSV